MRLMLKSTSCSEYEGGDTISMVVNKLRALTKRLHWLSCSTCAAWCPSQLPRAVSFSTFTAHCQGQLGVQSHSCLWTVQVIIVYHAMNPATHLSTSTHSPASFCRSPPGTEAGDVQNINFCSNDIAKLIVLQIAKSSEINADDNKCHLSSWGHTSRRCEEFDHSLALVEDIWLVGTEICLSVMVIDLSWRACEGNRYNPNSLSLNRTCLNIWRRLMYWSANQLQTYCQQPMKERRWDTGNSVRRQQEVTGISK